MGFCKSNQKTMPVVGFLTHNDCDVLRAKTDLYRWVTHRTIILPTMCHPCLFVCLFVSPSGLFPLIDGQWTSAKSDCTHSIRRGLSRRLRSSLLLNSSPRCDPPCRIVY